MNPKVITSVSEIQNWRRQNSGLGLGFVPTMGALHQGHGQLLKKARRENEITVLSVFVNKTQFNNAEDLEKYPRSLESDIELAGKYGVDVVFTPSSEEIYPDGYRYRIQESSESLGLCGTHRPGHFDGVLTVVMKLFQLIRPQRAYFGEKDYQQLQLIRGMVESFFLDLEICAVPTVREDSGLALSSRNHRLTPENHERASALNRILREKLSIDRAKVELEKLGFEVDYVEDRWNRRFAAASLGGVRLIDNVEL